MPHPGVQLVLVTNACLGHIFMGPLLSPISQSQGTAHKAPAPQGTQRSAGQGAQMRGSQAPPHAGTPEGRGQPRGARTRCSEGPPVLSTQEPPGRSGLGPRVGEGGLARGGTQRRGHPATGPSSHRAALPPAGGLPTCPPLCSPRPQEWPDVDAVPEETHFESNT